MSHDNSNSNAESLSLIADAQRDPRDRTIARLKRLVLKQAILKEVEDPRHGVVPSAAEDLLNRAYSVWEVSDDGSMVPKLYGEILFGPDGVSPIGIVDWIRSLRAAYGHLFVPDENDGPAEAGDPAQLSALARLQMANRQIWSTPG